MTRRGAIIAALLGTAAKLIRSAQGYMPGVEQPPGQPWPLLITFQKGTQQYNTGILINCRADPTYGGNAAICDHESYAYAEPDHVLEVVYGDRSVRLTASEIMDALELKVAGPFTVDSSGERKPW